MFQYVNGLQCLLIAVISALFALGSSHEKVRCPSTGARNENIIQTYLNIALLNVF